MDASSSHIFPKAHRGRQCFPGAFCCLARPKFCFAVLDADWHDIYLHEMNHIMKVTYAPKLTRNLAFPSHR